MRIVSWNINSLRRRQDRLLAWLAQTQPDVVCLQETKCTDEQFPADALRREGLLRRVSRAEILQRGRNSFEG